MMNVRFPLWLFSVLLLVGQVAMVQGQDAIDPTVVDEAPVRYDTDLLPPDFHRDRREAVKAMLPQDGVAIFFSAPVRNRENSVDYIYRQSSDLYYLTGTHEPESVLLLIPGGIDIDGRHVTDVLFVPPRDPHRETWDGRLFGAERAERELEIEQAVENTRYADIVGPILNNPSNRIFHLPLPDGIAAGTVLHQQVTFFRDQTRVLPRPSDPMSSQVTDAMLSVDDPDMFGRLKEFALNNLSADTYDEPVLQEAYTAFISSTTLSEWQSWKEENLADIADGTLLRQVLDELRTVKTGEELRLLRRSIDITTDAHREIMRAIHPGMAEYEVAALAEYTFKRNGAQYTAFPSIVASGENSVILHYNTNRRVMEAEDMVVIDIGAEYHGYAADVTRTLPVNGRFSEEQKAIYELVLEAQGAGIRASRSGAPFSAPDQVARRIIADGLIELGLISSASEVGRFFMHGTSHYLGLYVHDAHGSNTLLPGAVITVEPGVYISPAEDIDPRWWNIGVRIEDDILITDGDPELLSGDAPRTVDEIEALMERGAEERTTGG